MPTQPPADPPATVRYLSTPDAYALIEALSALASEVRSLRDELAAARLSRLDEAAE